MAEHTKPRGQVGVAGEGGAGEGAAAAPQGGSCQNGGLKIYFQNYSSNTFPLPSSPHLEAELGLGEDLSLIPSTCFHSRDPAHSWVDHPKVCRRLLPYPSNLPTLLCLCKGCFTHCLSHSVEAHR